MARQGNPYDSIVDSIIDVIGQTPVVELARLTKDVGGRILAKLEYLNPGFSKKDRIARQPHLAMLRAEHIDGYLKVTDWERE